MDFFKYTKEDDELKNYKVLLMGLGGFLSFTTILGIIIILGLHQMYNIDQKFFNFHTRRRMYFFGVYYILFSTLLLSLLFL